MSINILPALWHIPQSCCIRDCYGWVRFFYITTGSFWTSPWSVNSFDCWVKADTHTWPPSSWRGVIFDCGWWWHTPFPSVRWSRFDLSSHKVKQWSHPVSRGRHWPKSAAGFYLWVFFFFRVTTNQLQLYLSLCIAENINIVHMLFFDCVFMCNYSGNFSFDDSIWNTFVIQSTKSSRNVDIW